MRAFAFKQPGFGRVFCVWEPGQASETEKSHIRFLRFIGLELEDASVDVVVLPTA